MKRLSISVENAEYQILTALKLNRSKRSELGEIFIEGIESIKQAARAKLEFTRIVTRGYERLSDWAKNLIAVTGNAAIIEMDDGLYRRLCDKEEPSEIIVTARIGNRHLASIAFPDKPLVLIFDRPSDCGNFGSILRSANSFGVDAVFVVGHGIDIYEPKVIRSSLGSVFHTAIVNISSMAEMENWAATQKAENGMVIVGTDSTGSVSLKNRALARPLALILGNEAKGMSVALKALCDFTVSIPISGAVNSLNVACAGSILLWEIYKNG